MENKENKICAHTYESRIIKVLERFKVYLTGGKFDIGTLEQEKHYLFCNKCGDIKEVVLTINNPHTT